MATFNDSIQESVAASDAPSSSAVWDTIAVSESVAVLDPSNNARCDAGGVTCVDPLLTFNLAIAESVAVADSLPAKEESITETGTFVGTPYGNIGQIVTETYSFSDAALIANVVANVLETLEINQPAVGNITLTKEITEILQNSQVVSFGFGGSITETLNLPLTDVPVIAVNPALAIIETLVASGAVDTYARAGEILTELLGMYATTSRFFEAVATASLIMPAADQTAYLLRRIGEAVEDLHLPDLDAEPSARMFVAGTTELEASAAVGYAGSRLVGAVTEELVMDGVLVLPDGTAWVINTATTGLSQYDNFQFNSMAEINGKFHGASSTGIYEFAGDTDDGADIAARIRTGLAQYGTSRKKRISDIYIGYTSTGQIVLKVIYNQDNEKREAWYRLDDTSAAHDTARFKVGKGAKARYWGFELVNEDGADFDIDQIELFTLALNRRL